jgi:hypothetical protein
MEEKSQEQENKDIAKRLRFNFGVICIGVNPPLTLLPLGLVGAEIITILTIYLISQGD